MSEHKTFASPAELKDALGEHQYIASDEIATIMYLSQQLGKPLQVVLGNNEAHTLWPLSLILEREGWRFFLVHIPPRRVPAGVQVVFHGHTHVPRDETDPAGVRWLNPGCISRPNRGAPASFGWLTISREKPPEWKLVRI